MQPPSPPHAPLHVAHLAKYAPPARGGIETVVAELLAAFTRQQPPLEVECYCYAPRSGEQRLAASVTVRRRRTTAVVASAPISLALLGSWWTARRRADLIHVHLPNPWAVLLLLLLPPAAPIVAGVHAASTRYGPLRRPHDVLMRRLLDRAAAIVVSAHANADHLGLGRYHEKLHVVPYGIDPARIPSPSPPSTTIPARRRVLFVGRLVYYKGLDTLLAAAPLIDADLVILGDGPLYPTLHAQVAERGLDSRVRFVRDANDSALAEHLAACSLLVLPSSTTSESFGLSVLEAMAAAKPVVVTELGTGLDELVRTTGAGLVVPPRDPVALAAAVNELLADPGEQKRLGAAGRAAFERDYTSDQMASRTLAIYTKLATARHAETRAGR